MLYFLLFCEYTFYSILNSFYILWVSCMGMNGTAAILQRSKTTFVKSKLCVYILPPENSSFSVGAVFHNYFMERPSNAPKYFFGTSFSEVNICLQLSVITPL